MELEKVIIDSTREVFSMMAMLEVEAKPVVNGEESTGITASLSSMIGLGGDIKGMLVVHCTEELALGVTSSLLGIAIKEVGEDSKDAIGEIANMIAGNLKTAFAESKTDIALAIPSSVVGKSFSFSGMKGATRLVVPFLTETGSFWVELKYIENELK